MASRSKTKQELLDEIAAQEQRIVALERVNTQRTPGRSDHSRDWGPFLKRLVVLGAAGSIVVALMGLLGYVPGLGLLGSVREGYIPMAPSTAISFIVLGGILLAMTLRSPSSAGLVLFGAPVALVSLFGALEVAGHFTGRDLNFEDTLVPAAGYLGEIPTARMSPSTGALFFLAGLAVFALLWRVRTQGRETRLGHWGGSLGSLVLGIGLLFCLAYLYGSPLLYGQGATIPMALTTALAFLMLGAATVGVSGADAIPVSLLAAGRAGQPISARKRFLFLTLIMVGACAMVMAIMTVMLYRHDIKEHREWLQATVRSQARLIEAVARYDSSLAGILRDADVVHDPLAATLSQIIDAHEHYEGFGETGEFTLARRNGNFVVFVLRHRHSAVEHPAPVAFDSELAEPMRRALKGLSGTVIGLDYRGAMVLAAHEPVAVLNLGIVAKIDLAEIRAPFIRSGLAAAAFALLVVLAGTALFFRIGNPIIARLEAYSRDLEKEVEERKQADAKLKEYSGRLEDMVEERTVELREAHEQLIRKEKLAILGELASGVGHELRNPLGAIKNAAYFLHMALKKPEPDVKETIDILQQEVAVSEKIISSLLGFARPQPPSLRKVSINELLEDTLARVPRPKQVKVESHLNEELPTIQADPDQLRQVFDNLILNAVQAMPEGGQLSVSSDLKDKQWVTVNISDTGSGISKENLSKVFEPLFTTKAKGIGLGLAITRTLIEEHGGSIEVQSAAGQGATFTVRIPVDSPGVS